MLKKKLKILKKEKCEKPNKKSERKKLKKKNYYF